MNSFIPPGQPVELAQPNYLSGNWSRLLAGADDRLKYIRVMNGVATVFDKTIMLRHRLEPQVPDGFYFVDRKFLLPAKPKYSFGGSRYAYPNNEYPDVECYNPDFATLGELERIERGSIEGMLTVVDRIRQCDGTVVIRHDGIYMRQYNNQEMSYRQAFGISPQEIEIYVDAEKFYMALTELLRYDYSYFMIRRIDENSVCLVFGHNWDNCVLVSPQGMNSINGQYLR